MNKYECPLVSIIIPVYNGSDYMQEAIDSALNQTYENCEIIVINDGSKDGGKTERIALSYGDSIRYFAKKNGGVSSALNFGIKQMKGSYFSWLSHDDVYHKNKIKKQIEAIWQYGNDHTIVLCEISNIDKKSQPIAFTQKRRSLPSEKSCFWSEALLDLVKNGSFYGCGLLIPKYMLEECGYFRENLRYCQDYLMWLKLFMNKNPLIYIKAELVALRIHEGQLTQTGRDLYHKEALAVAKEVVPRLAMLSDKKNNFLFYYANDAARYNNPLILKQCFYMADRKGLFTQIDKIKLIGMLGYGKIRPIIRMVYYLIFRRLKTN